MRNDNAMDTVENSFPAGGEGRGPRTLEDLRFVPGDYLAISAILPKNVTLPTGPGAANSSTTPTGGAPGWKSATPTNGGPPGGLGRGGGHWRGSSDVPSRGRGGGRGAPVGRGDRDRDSDRRVPPPRRPRESPPRRDIGGYGGRNRSRSRSISPPRRRGSRYD